MSIVHVAGSRHASWLGRGASRLGRGTDFKGRLPNLIGARVFLGTSPSGGCQGRWQPVPGGGGVYGREEGGTYGRKRLV